MAMYGKPGKGMKPKAPADRMKKMQKATATTKKQQSQKMKQMSPAMKKMAAKRRGM